MNMKKEKMEKKTIASKNEPISKREATRRKIIAAARKVFTQHPFHAASIRMIGAEGGFDFTNIHHYFTKTELFEEVSNQLYEEVITVCVECLDGLGQAPVKEGLDIFLDRMIEYFFETPDVLEVLVLNMGHMKTTPVMPGFDSFTRWFSDVLKAFIEMNTILSFQEEVAMWVYGLATNFVYLIGGAASNSKALGMEAFSDEYKAWVKRFMVYLFLPPLEDLFRQACKNQTI